METSVKLFIIVADGNDDRAMYSRLADRVLVQEVSWLDGVLEHCRVLRGEKTGLKAFVLEVKARLAGLF